MGDSYGMMGSNTIFPPQAARGLAALSDSGPAGFQPPSVVA